MFYVIYAYNQILQIEKLCRFGAVDGRKTTRAIFAHLIDDQVCVQYSWSGKNSKQSFSSLTELIDIMLLVVRKKFETFTSQDLYKYLQEHLKFAPERLNTRIQ